MAHMRTCTCTECTAPFDRMVTILDYGIPNSRGEKPNIRMHLEPSIAAAALTVIEQLRDPS